MDSVGIRFRMSDYYEVGREKIREFARAVHDDHPAHFSEEAAERFGYPALIAPATFASIIGIMATRQLFEENGWASDLRNILQADQQFRFHQPILAGDRLIGEAYVESVRLMAGNHVMVMKNQIFNDRDEMVQTNYTTLIRRDSVPVEGDV
ncbi:(3R)-hydroxyacyl-ACP dehydratase subunit HadA [Hoyosella rhizosphaerae]|uniref:(3R)-hydroxyacyl-ACP dehydratase subunit HadA n=1 Tax=Hoyosella rhizosphaerae TaxID=1755582 RepID=UPI0035713B44